MLIVRFGLSSIRKFPVSEPVLAFTLVMMVLFAWSAEAFGKVAAITGAYLAGVFIAQTDLFHTVEEKIKPFSYALFVPIFFISIGLQTNLNLLHVSDLPFAILLILVAIASKVIGCGWGALMGGMSRWEALRVGIGMVSRGEVGLIVAGIGLQTGMISEGVFSVAVLMVIVTTLLTPIMIRWSFSRGDTIRPEVKEPVKGEKT
jgi:Kef-type K+ transport system membrane component KefB